MTEYKTWEEAVQHCMQDSSLKNLAYDSFFDDPIKAAIRYRDSYEFNEVKKLIPKNPGRALDLGAGNGILSFALASEGWDVTAVEPDRSSLVGSKAIEKIANEFNLPITILETYGESIPKSSASYDLVVARQVLHHANDLDSFCFEMNRLSNDRAIILTLRDHVISNESQLDLFLKRHPLHHLYGGEHAYTIKEYRKSILKSGLKIINQWSSFQSPLNYSPMSDSEFLDEIAKRTRILYPLTRFFLNLLPFYLIKETAAFLDRRPGRLVSFYCKKKA